mmetsp:Transcript_13837/g.39375  ORF Transcript_13837/g.39375 Transcript_13837/m.39375 type:complete len:223 (+) Transcript_13837:241-909(+)
MLRRGDGHRRGRPRSRSLHGGNAQAQRADHSLQPALGRRDELLDELHGAVHHFGRAGDEQPRSAHADLLGVLLDLDVAARGLGHLLHGLALVAHALAHDRAVDVQKGGHVADAGVVPANDALDQGDARLHAVGGSYDLHVDVAPGARALVLHHVALEHTAGLPDLLDRLAMEAQEVAFEARRHLYVAFLGGPGRVAERRHLVGGQPLGGLRGLHHNRRGWSP